MPPHSSRRLFPTGIVRSVLNAAPAVHAAARAVHSFRTPTRTEPRSRSTARSSRSRSRTRSRSRQPRSSRATSAHVVPTIKFKRGKIIKTNKKFKKKVLDAVAEDNRYLIQKSNSTTSNPGQASYTVFDLCSTLELGGISGLLPNTTPVIATSTTKYLLQGATMQVTMANMSTGVCFGTIYECIPRYDIPQSLTSAASIFTSGLAEPLYNVAQPTSTDLNVTPYMSPQFTTYFKISAVKNFELEPGVNQKVTFGIGSKIINLDRVKTANSLYLRDISKVYLFKQWGGICNDSVTKTNVSTDATKLDYVIIKTLMYKWAADLSVRAEQHSTLPTINTAQYINVDTDTVIVDGQA